MGHIQDRWETSINGRKVRTERYGQGKRWRARYRDRAMAVVAAGCGLRQGEVVASGCATWTSCESNFGSSSRSRSFAGGSPSTGPRGPHESRAAARLGGRRACRAPTPFPRRSRDHLVFTGQGRRRSAEQQLRLHVYPAYRRPDIVVASPDRRQALVQRLSASLAPSTVEVVYGRVVAVFRAAVRDRLIASTPCVGMRLPSKKGPSALVDVLTTEQVHAPANAIAPRYRNLVLVGAGKGLRPAELAGLAVDRVDFLRRTLRVDQQLVPGPRSRGRASAAEDDVLLPNASAPERRGVGPQQTTRPVGAHADLGLIFTNERDDPIQGHPFAMVRKTALRRAALPEWATPHDLRHYYASALICGGASVKVLQARLGHASAKTSLDTYGHLFPDEEDRTRATSTSMRRSVRTPPLLRTICGQ